MQIAHFARVSSVLKIMALIDTARRKIAAPQLVMVNERRSRELNHPDRAKRILPWAER